MFYICIMFCNCTILGTLRKHALNNINTRVGKINVNQSSIKQTFIKNLTSKKVHGDGIKAENETISILFQIDLLMKCTHFK